MSVHHVRRCLLCGAAAIDAKSRGRVVKTTCLTCRAALIIEFDPPDDPTIRARIERVARDRCLEGQLCSRCRRERWLFHVRLRRGIPEIGEAGRNLCL